MENKRGCGENLMSLTINVELSVIETIIKLPSNSSSRGFWEINDATAKPGAYRNELPTELSQQEGDWLR